MSKTIKGLTIGLGIIAGVAVVLGVLILLLFPTELFRERVAGELERRLDRPVLIGDARLALLPGLRVALRDVRVGQQAEPGKPRIAIESLKVRVRLLSLIRKQVEVTEIEIERPDIEIALADPAAESRVPPAAAPRAESRSVPALEERGSPESPRDRGAAPASAGEVGESKGNGSFRLKVNSLRVRDGRIRVFAANGKRLLALGGVSEDLSAEAAPGSNLSLAGITRIDTLRFHLAAGELGQGMHLKLEKRLRYDRSTDSLSIETADLDMNGLPVSVRGSITSVSSGRPNAHLKVQGGPGNVPDILGFLPSSLFPQMEGIESKGTVAVAARLQGPLSAESPRGTASRSKPDYDVDLTLSEGSIVHPRLREPIEEINLRLKLSPEAVEVSDLTASGAKSRIRARATVLDYSNDPRVEAAFEADIDLRELAALQPRADLPEVQGRTKAVLRIDGPVNDPQSLDISGTVDLQAVRVAAPEMKVPVEDLEGRILIHGRSLTLQDLSGRMGSSDFSARGTLANYTALQSGTEARGSATVDATIGCRLLDLDELTPTAAELRARTAPGKTPVSPAEMTAAFLAPLSGRVTLAADVIRTGGVEGRSARGQATIDRGLVRIEQLRFGTFGGEVTVGGTVDYRTPKSPKFDLKAQGRKVRISDLLGHVKSLDRFGRVGAFLLGEIEGTATLLGSLDDTLGLNLESLTSIGNLEIHDAKLANHPIQIRLADFLEAPKLKDLAITDWFQSFRIEEGRLILEKLSVKAGAVEVSASGWQSLDGRTQMSLDLLLPSDSCNGLRKQIPHELAAVIFDPSQPRILVPLHVSGAYDSPRISVDTDRLTAGARAQAQQKLADERRRLEEEAQRRAQGFLDGLKKSVTDSTATKQTAKETEKEIKKVLGDLFKKK